MTKAFTMWLTLNCLIVVAVYGQKPHRSENFGNILLQVDSWEGKVSATQFLAIYKNGTLFDHIWDDTLTAKILNSNPYTLYYKGNRVGEFRLDSLKVEEDYVWIEGTNSLMPEMVSHIEADSLRYWLTAISAGGSLQLPCIQPVGLTRETLLLDADCDGQIDTISSYISGSSVNVYLKLGNGITELVDSFTTARPLEKLYIDDIFDADADTVPEILTTQYTYPTYGFVLYKKVAGKWRRWFQSFGYGD